MMINLLQAILIAAILTTACLADGTDLALASAVGRQLLQASGALSQCGWGFNGVPGTCSATNFGLLSYNDTVYPANYPARAQAFLTAGNVYCSQFNSNVKSCTWPCFNNNQACVIADELTNTVWDCPNSKGRAFFDCPEAPHLTQAWCGTLPNCTYTPQKPTNNTNRVCEATFYANMSSSERLQFGPNYFVRIARELVGCCKGSNYRYAKNKMCSNATTPDECKKIKGCRFDDFYLNCKPSPQQLIKLLFEQNPKDPLNQILQAIATECDAIKDQSKCNNYKPVQVDKGKIYFYLNQNLDALNTPVSEARCRPQNIYPPSPPAGGKRMRALRRHALA